MSLIGHYFRCFHINSIFKLLFMCVTYKNFFLTEGSHYEKAAIFSNHFSGNYGFGTRHNQRQRQFQSLILAFLTSATLKSSSLSLFSTLVWMMLSSLGWTCIRVLMATSVSTPIRSLRKSSQQNGIMLSLLISLEMASSSTTTSISLDTPLK